MDGTQIFSSVEILDFLRGLLRSFNIANETHSKSLRSASYITYYYKNFQVFGFSFGRYAFNACAKYSIVSYFSTIVSVYVFIKYVLPKKKKKNGCPTRRDPPLIFGTNVKSLFTNGTLREECIHRIRKSCIQNLRIYYHRYTFIIKSDPIRSNFDVIFIWRNWVLI